MIIEDTVKVIISFYDIEDMQEDVRLVARSSEVVLKKGE